MPSEAQKAPPSRDTPRRNPATAPPSPAFLPLHPAPEHRTPSMPPQPRCVPTAKTLEHRARQSPDARSARPWLERRRRNSGACTRSPDLAVEPSREMRHRCTRAPSSDDAARMGKRERAHVHAAARTASPLAAPRRASSRLVAQAAVRPRAGSCIASARLGRTQLSRGGGAPRAARRGGQRVAIAWPSRGQRAPRAALLVG